MIKTHKLEKCRLGSNKMVARRRTSRGVVADFRLD